LYPYEKQQSSRGQVVRFAAKAAAHPSGTRWHAITVVDIHSGLANSPEAAFRVQQTESFPTFAKELELATTAAGKESKVGV
jgi:hypothetical protein